MAIRILVTGAAGFIGSNLVDSLLKKENQVMGIDNFDTYYERTIKEGNIKDAMQHHEFQFKEGDIRDAIFIDNCFTEFIPDVLVHLAAKAGVRSSLVNPQEYYDVNVMGTLNLLEVMRKHNIKKMIFASSSSVYGNNHKVPFAETDSVDYPISPYAASKKTGELLCHTYHHLYGFDIFCLRFFTVYGPRQRPDLAIHKFTKLIDEGKSIPFYGNGSTARDYTYIEDIVKGISCALNNLRSYKIYNLGESRVIKLDKLVKTIENALGKKANLNQLPLQQGDVKITYADISKAKAEIGYNPRYTFEDGMNEFI